MNVSACLVTRGDVDMQPVLDSLPPEWEVVVWSNDLVGPTTYGANGGTMRNWFKTFPDSWPDLSVYGRYAAIEYASNDLIYVADDDVIVSDPQAITDAWVALGTCDGPRDCVGTERGCVHCYPSIQESVVCNMPQEFRPHYPDSALVGFGACFHREAPLKAFDQFYAELDQASLLSFTREQFNRECDRVFTCLTPRVLVDVPKTDREFASDPNRLWRQPDHIASTKRMLNLARKVRDA